MNVKLVALLCASTAATVCMPTAANAQSARAGADRFNAEILVTARRREENIQTVPVAVTAVSGEAAQKVGVINVQDVGRIAPSVTIGSSTRGGGVPFLSIRGISSADIVGAIDPSIGIYVDEVIYNRPNGVLSSVYDIESIQVLRGPQGTLFGRNTVGGAILVSTRQPTDEFEGYARM